MSVVVEIVERPKHLLNAKMFCPLWSIGEAWKRLRLRTDIEGWQVLRARTT